jgi:hypothetical protein
MAEPELLCDGLRAIAIVPELSVSEKQIILKIIEKVDVSEESVRKSIAAGMIVLARETEKEIECQSLILRLIKASLDDQNCLVILLRLARRCPVELFESEDIFVEIVRNAAYDTRVGIAGLAVLKGFRSPKFEAIVKEYAFLGDIDVE